MGHDHSHEHGHDGPGHNGGGISAEQQEVLKRLQQAMALCAAFLVVEVIGGYLSGSLAVLSDAAHLFADLASFAVAIAAAHLASLPATDQHTFGLKRAESLAALLSMISLALVSIYLAVEACQRMYLYLTDRAQPVNGKLMSQVAFIGVLVNVALALILGVENHIHLPGAHHDHDHSHDHGGHDDHHDHGTHSHGEHNHEDHHAHEPTTATTSSGHDHAHSHGHDNDDVEEAHTSTCNHHDDDNDHHGHSHDHATDTTTFLPPSEKNKTEYRAIHTDEVAPAPQQTKKPLKNINLQAAYLHVFGDLLQSLGVFIAGVAIWINPAWTWVDPVCTLVFCAIVFYSTLGVLRHSISVLLQEVPPELSWQAIYTAIEQVEGVENVHDLHVWSISHGDPALAVHCSCVNDKDPQQAMKQITQVLKTEMNIHHITIQMQQGSGDCITCCENGGCDFARLSAVFNNSAQERSHLV